jgi:hypothetical protein
MAWRSMAALAIWCAARAACWRKSKRMANAYGRSARWISGGGRMARAYSVWRQRSSYHRVSRRIKGASFSLKSVTRNQVPRRSVPFSIACARGKADGSRGAALRIASLCASL